MSQNPFEEFTQRFVEGLPPGMKTLHDDLEKNVKLMVQGVLGKLDLVTREEFEVQTAVLSRTRELVDKLEKRVAELEQQSGTPETQSE